ncbi:MAG: hypothetical protein AAF648_07355 [Pseudomonadota bacterium]
MNPKTLVAGASALGISLGLALAGAYWLRHQDSHQPPAADNPSKLAPVTHTDDDAATATAGATPAAPTADAVDEQRPLRSEAELAAYELLAEANPALDEAMLWKLVAYVLDNEHRYQRQLAEHTFVTESGPLGYDCSTSYEVSPSADGLQPVRTCTPFFDQDSHPYFGYPTESLEALAGADPAANFVLGTRSDNETVRFNYMLRAAALSGKAGPLLTMWDSLGGHRGPGQGSDEEQMKKRYVVARLGQRMGFTTLTPELMAGDAQQHLTIDGLEALNNRVRFLEQTMDDLRQNQGLEPLFAPEGAR